MGGSSLGERNEKVAQIGNEDVVSAGWDREQKKKGLGGWERTYYILLAGLWVKEEVDDRAAGVEVLWCNPSLRDKSRA